MWSFSKTTIKQISRIYLKQPAEVLIEWRRDAQVRSARVNHSAAGAILADFLLNSIDANRDDGHNPVAKFWLVHIAPGQWFQHAPNVGASHSNFCWLVVLAISEENSEVGLGSHAISDEHVESTEVPVHGQAFQTEAQNSIKLEGFERYRGHLDCHDQVHLHTHGTVVDTVSLIQNGASLQILLFLFLLLGVADIEALLLDERCHLLPLQLKLLVTLSLIAGLCLAKANNILGELASDFSCSETDGNLLAHFVVMDKASVSIDRQRCDRFSLVIESPVICCAGLSATFNRREHDVGRPCVEDNPEVLSWLTDAQNSRVGGLERGNLALSVDGHALSAEADNVRYAQRILSIL
mmetsp:Transcript_57376/g.101791  ORF Transcript_57376/g.101791 Transcript_57376/m.101791 type:complete len:352 (-) Transcript_57376:239-1294(-)